MMLSMFLVQRELNPLANDAINVSSTEGVKPFISTVALPLFFFISILAIACMKIGLLSQSNWFKSVLVDQMIVYGN